MTAARPSLLRVWQLVAALGLSAFVAHVVFGAGGHGTDELFNHWLYCGLNVLAAGAALVRGLTAREDRAAWLALGGGLTSWTIGDVYYTFAFANDPSPPTPSIADGFYLMFYAAVYVALVLLVRGRARQFPRAAWWDGVLATLAFSALGAAVLVEAVLRTTSGSLGIVATNLAYPIGDTLLLSLTLGVFALAGWRPGRSWALIGGGFAAAAIADAVFLFEIAKGSYHEGGAVDALWPASMLLLAQASWLRTGRRGTIAFSGRRTLATPLACGLIGIGVLAYGYFDRLNLLALSLAIACLLAVMVRMGITFDENQKMLGRIRRQAVTDALTGLGNRRKLLADLETAFEEGRHGLLVVYDLDGFKGYNDGFGHPAGDALLERLGTKLAAAVRSRGESYRLGGDEFCVLAPLPRECLDELVAETVSALSESGEAFRIQASYGSVVLPDEAGSAAAALGRADQRLYEQKDSRRTSRQRQDLLLRAAFERDPAHRKHARMIGSLAVEVGRVLGLEDPELEQVRRAAELHDVGTVAIPDEILHKPGPLDEAEWAFVRRHTELGQRILEAAPTLAREAELMRSTHERWDGNGYPDRLAGEEIPLGSRIISACTAFTAMTSDRPYRARMTDAEALAELQRCAGTQFDPRVARAIALVIETAGDLATAA